MLYAKNMDILWAVSKDQGRADSATSLLSLMSSRFSKPGENMVQQCPTVTRCGLLEIARKMRKFKFFIVKKNMVIAYA